jgi:ribonuclease BN (tRNA processing enzyme)
MRPSFPRTLTEDLDALKVTRLLLNHLAERYCEQLQVSVQEVQQIHDNLSTQMVQI